MPKNPGLDVFSKANLGINERFHLGNLYLMKDWEYTRTCEYREDVKYSKDTKKLRQFHIIQI